MTFYLGIDGGGSKTICIAGDATSILGQAQTGACNVVRVGEASARGALQRAVREACEKSGIALEKITRTVAGVAGVGRPEIREFVHQLLRELVGGEVRVVSDAETALHATFGDNPGVVVIAGTGSIAFAQNGQGQTARAGGWGWAISDEGSGPWMGRAAVTAILRAHDAGETSEENTQLEQRVLRAWQLTEREALVRAANTTPPPDFGALLPEIVAAANAGDTLAQGVFLHAGEELARLAALAAQRIFGHQVGVRVAMSGGAFTHAPNLRQAFYNSLQTQLPNAEVPPELADAVLANPALGALQMARRG